MKKAIYFILAVLAILLSGLVSKNYANATCCNPNQQKKIWIKKDSLITIPSTEHHFIITGVLNITPPLSINIKTSDYQWHVVSFERKTGNAAHYFMTLSSPMTVIDGWAWINDCWTGQFVESVPTAVELLSFTTVSKKRAIEVNWETGSEIDNLGFNLYRAEKLTSKKESAGFGKKIKINNSLIPSQATGSPFGAQYKYVDSAVRPGTTYYYWLEDVDVNGQIGLNGPVSGIALK